MADIQGYDPVTGTVRYYTHDHLGSTRTLRSQAKATLARFDYDPYGGPTYHDGASATRTYTGHDLDPVTGMYFAPFRYYAPGLARWTARDPLGMYDNMSMYSYVSGEAISTLDLLGLAGGKPKKCGNYWYLEDKYHHGGAHFDIYKNVGGQPATNTVCRITADGKVLSGSTKGLKGLLKYLKSLGKFTGLPMLFLMLLDCESVADDDPYDLPEFNFVNNPALMELVDELANSPSLSSPPLPPGPLRYPPTYPNATGQRRCF